MKKIIFIVLLLLSVIWMPVRFVSPENGTTYYVDATNGKDYNDGTAPVSAWKTLARVSGGSFNPGDTILFKRGEIWREFLRIPSSGSIGAPITFGAYGDGEKPLFLGSITRNNLTDWVDLGGNLWATSDGSFPYDVGFILLGDEDLENVGKKRDFLLGEANEVKEEDGNWYVLDGVNEDKEFWYDGEKQRVILYCYQNPASEYSNIEIGYLPHWNHLICGSEGIQYITIENLQLKYFNAHGIQFVNSRGIIIKDCDISYGGGTYLERKVRYGNGIEFWDNTVDCRVENCKIGMLYDAAVTNQGSTDGITQENIYYINNILWNSEYSLESWARPSSATIRNVYFENNTCLGAGFGWGHQQRYDPHGWHMALWGNDAQVESLYIRYNVFYESISSAFFLESGKKYDGLILDYNYYYETAGILICYESAATYTMDQFSTYQTNEGQDIHSYAGDKSLAQEAARSMVEVDDLDFLNDLFDATDNLVLEYTASEINPNRVYGFATTIALGALTVIFFWNRKKRR